MKIGVFGDSYVAMKVKENETQTWVDILSTKHDVTNHGVLASNLYYSVKLIQEIHQDYDKIILAVTEPGRIKVPDWLNYVGPEKFILGLSDWKLLNIEYCKGLHKEKVYEAARQYLVYLQETEYENYIHSLMLEDVKKCRPDIVLIPAFPCNFFNDTSSIFDISIKENEVWNTNFTELNIDNRYFDIRNCHMTAENNEIFAGKVEQWLNGNPVHIDLNDFMFTTNNKDFYLRQL